METLYKGAALDTRPQEEKDKDFQSIEIASSSPVNWREKKQSEWKKYPVRNQDGSSTCVGQTLAKMLGIENHREEGQFIVFSARDPYQRRINAPGEGMGSADALSIGCKFGITTDELLPSQNMSEKEINAPFTRTQKDIEVGKKYRGGGFVNLPFDIDAIGDVIENKGKGVMLFFFATMSEWNQDVPTIKGEVTLGTATVRHSVTGVETTMHNGEKAIIIDDSWGKFAGLKGQRIITESFLKKRCYYAGYILDLSNNQVVVPDNKPRHKFSKVLTFNMRNDSDVKALQNILKHEGLFPSKVESTGNYLQITAKGLYQWQIKHSVAPIAELNSLGGKRVGPKTINKLNELYS